jgi:relaxase-like protein
VVINGASRRNVGFWVKHLQNDKKNDRAELKEVRGLAADNLRDALLEMQDDAQLTQCKNFMYQANFNPCEHEHLTEEQWERTFEIFEQHRGIPPGQPRVVYEHEKEGRTHRHVIWSRIDLEQLKAWPDGLDAKICHAAAREISEELGLQRSISPFDKDREGPRPPRAPKSYEMFRGLQSGLDPRDITAEVTGIFRDSASAAEFEAGLQFHGYQLAQGNRRDFCILDSAGDVHSLARRLDGVKTKELRTFMRDLDREAFPTVDQAKTQYQERMTAQRQADLATVQQEIAWEEALAKAAIEKEKTSRAFSQGAEEPTVAAQPEKQERPAPPELGRTAGEIRLAYSLTSTGQAFADALEDRGLFLTRVSILDLEKLKKHRAASRN